MPAQAHSASLSAQRRFRLGFKQAAITFSALPWTARLSPAAGVMTGLAAETRIGRAAARTRMVRAAAASGKSTGAGWQAVSALALIGPDRDRYAALWRRVQSESAAPLRALEDAAAAVTAAAVAASAARGREGHRRGLQVGDEGRRRAAGSGRRNSDAPKAVVSDEDTPPSPPTSPHSFSLLSFPSVPPSSKPESVVVGPPLLTVGPSVNAPSIPHTLLRACPPSFRSSTSVLPSLALSLALSLAPASPPQTLRPSLCPSVPFVPPFLPQSVSPAVLSFRLFVPCFVPPFR